MKTKTVSANSLANLKPWKKGQSGNPGGRPKRDASADIAQAILEGNEESIYAALGKKLLEGDEKVFKALAERAYGRPVQKVELTGEDGGAIAVSVTFKDANG